MILVLHFWWKWSWDLAPNAACFDESFRHRIETSEIFWVCWALEPQITWCSWQSFWPCGRYTATKKAAMFLVLISSVGDGSIPADFEVGEWCLSARMKVCKHGTFTLWRCWALGSPFGHFITINVQHESQNPICQPLWQDLASLFYFTLAAQVEIKFYDASCQSVLSKCQSTTPLLDV